MNTAVVYKTKYGSSRIYAEWIGEELNCPVFNAGETKISDLLKYDTIIYGGGLYAEVINGLSLITKNIDSLKNKKLIVFTTGITPVDCRDYYDKMVVEKNFKNGVPDNLKIYNFPGKMKSDELSFVHKTALKTLKTVMLSKQNRTEMENMLIDLCDADGDFTDRGLIRDLVLFAGDRNNI